MPAPKACCAVLVFVAIVCFIVGIVLYFVILGATKRALKEELIIDSPNAKNYVDFQSEYDADDEAIYYTYWVYNLTNVDAYKAGREVPNLNEIGPFVYRYRQRRLNLSFSDGGQETSWYRQERFFFEPSRSVMSDQTVFTSFNPWYVAVERAAGGEGNLNLLFVPSILAQFRLQPTAWGQSVTFCALPGVCGYAAVYSAAGVTMPTTKATTALAVLSSPSVLIAWATLMGRLSAQSAAGNAAGAGATLAALQGLGVGVDYTTPIPGTGTTEAGLLANYILGLRAAARAVVQATIGPSVAKGLLFRTVSVRASIFGPDPFFFATQGVSVGLQTNMTGVNQTGGQFTVRTGKVEERYANMGYYRQFDGTSTVRLYPGLGAYPVAGRTETIDAFQGSVRDRIEIYFFVIKRYAAGIRTGMEPEILGIPTINYRFDTNTLLQADNRTNITVNGCAPLGPLVNGAPFYVTVASLGDQLPAKYRNAVTGLNYNPRIHDTYLNVEQTTGLPMDAALRVGFALHINMTANSYSDMPSPNATSRDIFVPMLFLQRGFTISESRAEDLRYAVVTLRRASVGIIAGLLTFGFVLLLIAVACIFAIGTPEERQKTTEPVADEKTV